jgi:hypothetical protein
MTGIWRIIRGIKRRVFDSFPINIEATAKTCRFIPQYDLNIPVILSGVA